MGVNSAISGGYPQPGRCAHSITEKYVSTTGALCPHQTIRLTYESGSYALQRAPEALGGISPRYQAPGRLAVGFSGRGSGMLADARNTMNISASYMSIWPNFESREVLQFGFYRHHGPESLSDREK